MRISMIAASVFISAACLVGCSNTDSEGLMRSQSGELVDVHQDYVGDNFMFRVKNGDPYYYENGAKVYVNRGDGNNAPDRPTSWNGDK